MNSMLKKEWKPRKQYPLSFAKKFSGENEMSLQLLFSGGIKTADEADKFFNPDYERDLHDPFRMLSMDKAVERFIRAITNSEKIVVFGDYDADGICAAVIFQDFFKKIGFSNFEIYIPDCYLEGHGLSKNSIQKFSDSGCGLIVTVDCGISNHEEVLMAKELGIDVIITDHHSVLSEKPEAFAVVDTQQEDCGYPFKSLTGAGVAFKVVSALLKTKEFSVNSGWEKWLLDLVAIATIADMLPLRDENRVLVHYGIQVLQKTRRLGLKILCQKTGLNLAEAAEDEVGFVIAPHINAASRMDHANTSFLLLATDSGAEAEWLTSRLVEKNNERKVLVEKVAGDVKGLYKKENVPPLIIAGRKDWQPGVLGIAANKILEEFDRPVFLWGKGESKIIRGSARSRGATNLVELMKRMPPDFFEDFGGHPFSGGFSFGEEKVSFFEKYLSEAFFRFQSEEARETGNRHEAMIYEKELFISDVNWDFLKIIDRFRPFGFGHPRPIFVLKGVIPENIKTFGNGGAHLRLYFRTPANEVISAIGFFMSKKSALKIEKGAPLDLAFSLEKSNFRGYSELRMRIVDIKF